MDVLARLRKLLADRGWTEYKLAIQCGLSHSTIANIFKRKTIPSITTLETICNGFGITLSQFFASEGCGEITEDLKEVFDLWLTLTPKQKQAFLEMLRVVNDSR